MQFCSVFNPNPVYTSMTVSGLTPAGFVKNSAAGLLSTEAPGMATYIPYSSGTGFSYSANMTFSGTALVITGTGQFSYAGIGASPNSIYGLNLSKVAAGTTIKGIQAGVTNNTNGAFGAALTACIDFNSIFQPLSPTSNRTCTALHGGTGQATCSTELNANYNATATNARAFYASVIAQEAGGGTGVANIGTGTAFYASACTKGLGAITTIYAFYDAGQTAATTNWGCAINTQSYFNANVSIGKNTAPAVPLDVVGAILNTTTIEAGTGFKCGGTAAVADGTYTVGARLTPVTGIDGTITTKGGIITAIQPAT